ncbi:hypothetical protein GYMLUDRAFT_33808 [Collybiopsis luxurians FD-317 M1]|nr:hypothetical protein GYMLUDRAFT_33808 [Collybiopsis luxurians FD-317 M1]
MNTPRLPQELCDLLIDESSDSSDALKTLSLVHRSWLPRARKHLFHRLHLPHRLLLKDKRKKVLQRRLDLMKRSWERFIQNTDIARCIKGFFLSPEEFKVGSRFGGLPPGSLDEATCQFAYADHPCEPSDKRIGCKFLVFSPWMECQFLSQVIRFFRIALEGKETGIKSLDLLSIIFEVGELRNRDDRAELNLFECLAECAPSLDTLCIRDMSLRKDVGDDQLASIEDVVRQAIHSPSGVNQNITNREPIPLKRFLLSDSWNYEPELVNIVMKVLLFEHRSITFKHLVHLAITSTTIPLFAVHSIHFCNIKHLTIIDSLRDEENEPPDVWVLDKYRLDVPALERLQLVIFWHESLLTLCRLIIGPNAAEPESKVEASARIEYPGPAFDLFLDDRRPSLDFPYPRVKHLHVEFDFAKLKTETDTDPVQEKSLAERVDAVLHSYLNLGHSDIRGPLKYISTNLPDSTLWEKWPRTRSTGKLYQGQCDSWWDSRWW